MIKSIGLKNFKCFVDINIPLAPFTLLTGFNATGKSTTTQGLLLIAQALRQQTPGTLLPLNGELVELGTAIDVLCQVGGEEIALTIRSTEEDLTWTFLPGRGRYGTHLQLRAIEQRIAKATSREATRTLASPANIYPAVMQGDIGSVVEQLSNLVFVSAVRNGPSDTFPSPVVPQPVIGDVGKNGEYAAWWFAADLDEEVQVERRHPLEPSPILRRQLNAWANDLFPGFEANAVLIRSTNLVRLELRTHETDAWRRPANIGYGITYIFPILVAGLLTKPDQILIVDSPEAHLHPMGQSKIGEFLAIVANSGTQVIVETHSDHVLNGARLAVRNGRISNDDIFIHFFNQRPSKAEDPAHVVAIWMDAQGNLSEWPDGFFDQSEKDLAEISGWNI